MPALRYYCPLILYCRFVLPYELSALECWRSLKPLLLLSCRTRSITVGSTVPKSLFQDGEGHTEAADLGDKVIEEVGDLSETDQVIC